MGCHWDENASTLSVVLLAFFTVVASSPNLSTFKFGRKGKYYLRITIHDFHFFSFDAGKISRKAGIQYGL